MKLKKTFHSKTNMGDRCRCHVYSKPHWWLAKGIQALCLESMSHKQHQGSRKVSKVEFSCFFFFNRPSKACKRKETRGKWQQSLPGPRLQCQLGPKYLNFLKQHTLELPLLF